MIQIDRLSLPAAYKPKVGDVLVITEMIGDDRRGRWKWKMAKVDMPVIPKDAIAWLLRRLNSKDAAEFMLWCSTGKPLA